MDSYKQLNSFSKKIKNLRKENKFTQVYVAKNIGVKYQSYQNYERGVTLPTLENLIKLADFYNVSLDFLIDRKRNTK